jgi:hypothetical protein
MQVTASLMYIIASCIDISPCCAVDPLLIALLVLLPSCLCTAAADYNARLGAGINAAVTRFKDYDSDTRESLRQELVQSAEFLDQAARLAMAAMLQVMC